MPCESVALVVVFALLFSKTVFQPVATFKKSGMLRPQTKLWTSKYLNNMIEQDHRKSETARLPDARLQEVRQCGRHD
jgi:hypothetical protein